MNNYLETASQGQYLGSCAPTPQATLKVRLEYAVQEAEQRLTEAKRAKEIFTQHPELEELLNIMQKGRF